MEQLNWEGDKHLFPHRMPSNLWQESQPKLFLLNQISRRVSYSSCECLLDSPRGMIGSGISIMSVREMFNWSKWVLTRKSLEKKNFCEWKKEGEKGNWFNISVWNNISVCIFLSVWLEWKNKWEEEGIRSLAVSYVFHVQWQMTSSSSPTSLPELFMPDLRWRDYFSRFSICHSRSDNNVSLLLRGKNRSVWTE